MGQGKKYTVIPLKEVNSKWGSDLGREKILGPVPSNAKRQPHGGRPQGRSLLCKEDLSTVWGLKYLHLKVKASEPDPGCAKKRTITGLKKKIREMWVEKGGETRHLLFSILAGKKKLMSNTTGQAHIDRTVTRKNRQSARVSRETPTDILEGRPPDSKRQRVSWIELKGAG